MPPRSGVNAELFEDHRGRLLNIAYGMLGSVMDAEDVVQDVYLRWAGVDAATVESPGAYLTTMTTRRSQHSSEMRTGLEKELQRAKVKGKAGPRKGISKDLLTEPRKGPAKGSMENQLEKVRGKKERVGEAC